MWRLRGFTLIELMVVLVIVAIASAGVMVAIPSGSSANLKEDAARLAAVMNAAHAQSVATGQSVTLIPNNKGFDLTGITPSNDLKDWYAWKTKGIGIHLLPSGAKAIALGPDPIGAAQAVVLSTQADGGQELYIASYGIAPFQVLNQNPFLP